MTEPSDAGGFIVTYRLNPDDTLAATATKEYRAEAYETTLRRLADLSVGEEGGTMDIHHKL